MARQSGCLFISQASIPREFKHLLVGFIRHLRFHGFDARLRDLCLVARALISDGEEAMSPELQAIDHVHVYVTGRHKFWARDDGPLTL